MKGKIALEEAFTLPSEEEKQKWWASMFAVDQAKHTREVIDIQNIRLEKMNQHGIGYMILSCTAPGVQDIYEADKANEMAVKINDYIAEQIKDYPDRFGAFATLSMHDPKVAADEIHSLDNKYRFIIKLINDNQRNDESGSSMLFYDDPSWYVLVLDILTPLLTGSRISQGCVLANLYRAGRSILSSSSQPDWRLQRQALGCP